MAGLHEAEPGLLTGRLCVWGQVMGVGSRVDRKILEGGREKNEKHYLSRYREADRQT